MPTYTYACPSCKAEEDVSHSMNDTSLIVCPYCLPLLTMSKIITAPPAVNIAAKDEAVPTKRRR